VPRGNYVTTSLTVLQQRRKREEQSDAQHGHRDDGGRPLRRLTKGMTEVAKLDSQRHQQQRNDPGDLREELRIDRAPAQLLEERVLFGHWERGDLGPCLRVHFAHDSGVQDVPPDGAGDITGVRAEDERDDGPGPDPVVVPGVALVGAENRHRIGVERTDQQDPHRADEQRRGRQIPADAYLVLPSQQDHVDPDDDGRAHRPPPPEPVGVAVAGRDTPLATR
jgi:hypothetical protein